MSGVAANAQERGKQLFGSLFASSGNVFSAPSSALGEGLKQLIAPASSVSEAARSLPEVMKAAAELQKALNPNYAHEVITAIAPIRTTQGEVHLMKSTVVQAATFIRVQTECYNIITRSSTSVGLTAGDMVLGISDARMKEQQKLVGLVTGGCFFFVKSTCMFCPENKRDSEAAHQRLLRFLNGEEIGSYSIYAFEDKTELTAVVREIRERETQPRMDKKEINNV